MPQRGIGLLLPICGPGLGRSKSWQASVRIQSFKSGIHFRLSVHMVGVLGAGGSIPKLA